MLPVVGGLRGVCGVWASEFGTEKQTATRFVYVCACFAVRLLGEIRSASRANKGFIITSQRSDSSQEMKTTDSVARPLSACNREPQCRDASEN